MLATILQTGPLFTMQTHSVCAIVINVERVESDHTDAGFSLKSITSAMMLKKCPRIRTHDAFPNFSKHQVMTQTCLLSFRS
jgi:hypothetical protein